MRANELTPWQPAIAWHCPKVLWWLGSGGVLLYAAFRVLWPQVGSPAETAMALIGLGSLLTWGAGLRGSAALWLLLAAIAVQVVSWSLGYFHHPQWIEDNPQVDRLAKLFIFIAVAWWLGGSTRNTLVMWGVGLLAFLGALFVQGGGLEEWRQGFRGHRVDFGIRNAQHTAILFATGFLGLVAFVHRCVHDRTGRVVFWRLLLWLGGLSVCLAGVVITQTRAVWLALAIVLPFMGALWLLYALRQQGVTRVHRRLLAGGALLAFLMVASGALFHDTVAKRLEAERPVIDKVLAGRIAEVPYTSVGIRVQTWRAATEWIAERPWVGWGGEGRGLVIEHTEWLPASIKSHYGHLHNSFLEIWVAYGLLGLAVMGGVVVWVGRGTCLAWRGGVLPGDMALFAAGFFVFWMVVNQFEAYLSFWTGVYVHNLILGGLVTHYWRWKRDTAVKRGPAV